MTTLGEVCRHVRSKNAGPFWITLDLFFPDRDALDRYKDAPALSVEAVAALFDADPGQVRRFVVADLAVLKFSYPRPVPQGGWFERDMHGGQQFARLLHVEL